MHMDKPKVKVEKFNKYLVDDITVYLYKGADIKKDKIVISLSKFLFLKSLEVKGISVI